MVKGARIYVECRNLRIDTWQAQDGTQKHGLSAMSGFTRLAAIGRNAPPKRDGDGAPTQPAVNPQRPRSPRDEMDDDPLPF